MNKITYCLILSLLIAILGVIAIPNPAPLYCENMGYNYNETDCIFGDGNSCELWKFYNGECGAEYIKNLSCKNEGESLAPGYECCEGLTSISRAVYVEGVCEHSFGGWPICAPCGNGICDEEFENPCNCREDCSEKQEVICYIPNCTEKINTGKYDEKGCIIYECPEISDEEIKNASCENGICNTNKSEQSGCVDCPEDNCSEDCNITKTEEVFIEKKSSGETSIKSSNIEVVTMEEIEVINSTLAMKTSEGDKEITFLPKEVISKTEIKNITKTELIQESNKPVYLITGINKGKLFLIFPIIAEIKQKINAETGEIISTKKPWWSFLASGI